MSTRYSFAFALAVMVVAAMVVGSAVATPNTNFVSSACNTQKIPSGSSFYSTLGSLLVDLEGNTAFSGYDYKASQAGSPTAYGRGVCNQGISQSDCTACLKNLGGRIWNICGNAIGARVQLTDCFIEYEQYSF